MKIAVTGSTGFIGKHLLKRLEEEGHSFCRIDRSFENNVEKIAEFLKKEKCDGVIHLGALYVTNHKPEQVVPLVTSNILFGTAVLEAATLAGIPWFINTGTFAQHYKNKEYSPVDLYSSTKQAFEDIGTYYSEAGKINFVTIQIGDTFGPNDTRPKILNLWMKHSESGIPLEMSPGLQKIDLNYITNVIDAYMRLAELLKKNPKVHNGKVYVVTSGEVMNLRKLAELFQKVTNRKVNILWGKREYPSRINMFPWTKGKKIPGWKPRISIKEGIKKLFTSS